jgi:hypothetical protein
MECNFSQIQNYFKFSNYKGHPTTKITAPPLPLPPPPSLSNYNVSYSNVKAGSEYVMYVQNTSYFHTIHIHMKEVLSWIFLCNFTRRKLR